jgi:putative ABC transport system substrate-binding protein
MAVAMFRCLRMVVVAWLLVAVAGGVNSATAAGKIKPHVVVLISHDAAPYHDALNGFERALAQRGMDADLEVVALQGDAQKVAPAMLKAKRDGAALVFTMGLVATQAALAENSDIPVVAGLILSADSLKKRANATGVVLEMPMKLQFEWIQRLMPSDTTVGVLYNPAENQQKVEEAEGAARGMGLKLVAFQVDTAQSLPNVLETVAKRVDVLWAIPDSVVVSPETAKTLLVYSFRNRIPFIGLSSAWVKAGALFALDWDYEDVGAQCGELAIRIFRGTRAGSIVPESPRRVTYAVNRKTAREMRVVLSESVISGAAKVYE